MVECKYFQQGNCRFGQYCRYEHVNAYASNGNRTKPYDGKNIALVVAEDVLAAERGGQWLLSCFGPFKEQASIPGMEDLSPEEVRWEMYQAEKKGNVDQVKIQFQQLCQDLKAKRDVLKNPTTEILTMLENIQKSGQESTSNFSFATPQRGTTTPSSTVSVFGGKSFGSSGNPFGGNFSSTGGNSLFGGSTTTNSVSVFGSNPTYVSNSVFGSTPSSTSLFGGASKVSPPAFGATTTQAFGAQPVFGQIAAFGATQNSPFLRPATTAQTSSVFGGSATNTFGGSAPPTFGNPGIFGNSGSSTAFGTTATPTENSSVFGQPKTTSAFGAAPVFAGTNTFGATQPGSVFGGQSSFGSAPVTTNSIFGGSTTSTTMFGSAQNATGFGSPTPSALPIFGGSTQPTSFGSSTGTFGQTSAVSTPFGKTAGTPFGQLAIASTPFATTSGPFGTATTAPFSQSAPFGQTVTGTVSSLNFGNAISSASSTPGFGVPSTAPPPFGAQINFGSVVSSPFANANTTVTTNTANPFMATSQVTSSGPFGSSGQNQNTFSSAGSGPFGKPAFGGFSATAIVDESIFTAEGLLTDDEKSWYLQERFVLGKIPLKAPTKEMR